MIFDRMAIWSTIVQYIENTHVKRWPTVFTHEAALQDAIKGGNLGAKLTHLCGF